MLKTTIVPICRTCKHLLMDIKYTNDYSFARCSLLGKQSIVSGDIVYPYAETSRRNYAMCGEEGKYYEKSQSETHTYNMFNKC